MSICPRRLFTALRTFFMPIPWMSDLSVIVLVKTPSFSRISSAWLLSIVMVSMESCCCRFARIHPSAHLEAAVIALSNRFPRIVIMVKSSTFRSGKSYVISHEIFFCCARAYFSFRMAETAVDDVWIGAVSLKRSPILLIYSCIFSKFFCDAYPSIIMR